ncbi:hypothetical protein RRG08_022306 [Elysia crispata]|uniref:Uncharacterized protein n=1 Tax=Elysia crispata TaxID=231223 RepID=A0AAE1DKB0_9GAST|nr:hypothetical protein RRG08_022306 [Elysia crispata]
MTLICRAFSGSQKRCQDAILLCEVDHRKAQALECSAGNMEARRSNPELGYVVVGMRTNQAHPWSFATSGSIWYRT